MKKIKALLLALMLSFTLLFVASCDEVPAEDLWEEATYRDDAELGEGNTHFTLIVKADEQSVSFSVNTDKKTVGDALVDLGLLEGENGQYGLYVKKVNGILADYGVDQTYWAFYINGEYAMTGVDTTEVVNGATYTLSREK